MAKFIEDLRRKWPTIRKDLTLHTTIQAEAQTKWKENSWREKVQIKRVIVLKSVMIGIWRQFEGREREKYRGEKQKQKKKEKNNKCRTKVSDELNTLWDFEVCWRHVGVSNTILMLFLLLFDSREMHFVCGSSTWYPSCWDKTRLTLIVISRSRFADLKSNTSNSRQARQCYFLFISSLISSFFFPIFSHCRFSKCFTKLKFRSNGTTIYLYAMGKVDAFWHVDGINVDGRWKRKKTTHTTNGVNLSTLV